MILNKYKAKLQYDNGFLNLTVTAESTIDAKTQIMNCEDCPESAIVSIECLGCLYNSTN